MRSALFATVFMVAASLGSQGVWAEEALSKGQTVYVPVYSHISHGNLDGRGKASELLLSSMLSLRNTDPALPITITSARYYDTDGKMLREFMAKHDVAPPVMPEEVAPTTGRRKAA